MHGSTLLFLLAPALVAQDPPAPAPQASAAAYDVVWTTPSPAGAGAAAGMPIGNGQLGVLAWVEEGSGLGLQLGRTDTWDGNGRLLSLARARLTLEPSPFAPGAPFEQALRLDEGTVRITAGEPGSQVRIDLWVDSVQDVLRIDVDADARLSARFAFEPWRTEERALEGLELASTAGFPGSSGQLRVTADVFLDDQGAGGPRLVWYQRSQHSIWRESLEKLGLEGWLANHVDLWAGRTFGGAVSGPGFERVDERTLASSAPAASHRLDVYTRTTTIVEPEEWLRRVARWVGYVNQTPRDKAREATRAWWREFWGRSWIHLSGDDTALAVGRAYALQRYLLALGARGSDPMLVEGSVFNVDAGFGPDLRPGGGLWRWGRVRWPYWAMFAAGDLDGVRPLLRLYANNLGLANHAARTWFGHGGLFYPEVITPWGTWSAEDYGWKRGEELAPGVPQNALLRRHFHAGVEVAVMMLEAWRHTGDTRLLESAVLPHCAGVTEFYRSHYGGREGAALRIAPAQSLGSWLECVDPAPEIAGLARMLELLEEVPAEFVQPEWRVSWDRLAGELPSLPTRSEGGRTLLAPAASFAEPAGDEFPELYSVFPYRRFGPGNLGVAAATLEQREDDPEGAGRVVLEACLGRADAAARGVALNLTAAGEGFRFEGFVDRAGDGAPDMDHRSIGMLALQNMLLQPRGEQLLVLPAWPAGWDADFKLHGPGGRSVEGRVRSGRLQSLRVTPWSALRDVRVLGED